MSEPSPSTRLDDGINEAQRAHSTESDIRGLVKQHYEMLYRYAYRLTGNVADAEDLTQQTYLAAQEKLHQLRDLEAARSWLFQILRRLFLKSCRKRQPNSEIDTRMSMEDVAVETDFDTGLNAEFIQEKLDELPDHFRLALLMFYFEGKSYETIAKTLDIPLGTVMSRLARAKNHLRSRLQALEASR